MHLCGNSKGNGAGWPTRFADSAGNFQILFVKFKNSSFVIVFSFLLLLFLLLCCGDADNNDEVRGKLPLQNTKIYSWTSLNVGLDAESQLPHAAEIPALAALFQIISPRIKIQSLAYLGLCSYVMECMVSFPNLQH